ncbi:hypothetical protein J8273_6033 [Carpediemonas membranifera]|uniref:Band 7 domain-containing protein n=1 Tax=Carpediemonas membranifera TaxID=201153 RepID=A0A8J6E912_9EUKA|nr:hypothetical protein J8273_6033 [Carpediemonas membranifera]|eukprot:KAG9392665.1 hypothetical protein J8273_6033 [Carpediemonas membranifera]
MTKQAQNSINPNDVRVEMDDSQPAAQFEPIHAELQSIFLGMLRHPDNESALMNIIIPANANRDADVIALTQDSSMSPSEIPLIPFSFLLPTKVFKRLKVVKPQEFVIVSHSGRPSIKGEGTYFLWSPRQDFEATVPRTTQHIEFRGLHIYQVPRGHVGLVWKENRPMLLGEGRHVIKDPNMKFEAETKSLASDCFKHGTINIVRIPRGMLGHARLCDSSKPLILAAGLHVIDDSRFQFIKTIELNAQINKIGALELVRIETGQVGVAYKSGKLTILQPGLHLITPPDRFDHHLSTQQQVLHLPETVHESADYVPLRVKADVFYIIKDPYLALSTITDIENTIKETANATLAGIIRSSTLADIAQSSRPSFHEEHEGHDASAPMAPPGADHEGGESFYNFVHDSFITQLYSECKKRWGIVLQNIRVEQLKIDDDELAKQISNQSLLYAQTQARLKNLEADRHIQLKDADRNANVSILNASGKRDAAALDAAGEAAAMVQAARAKAESLVIDAEAKARATTIKAEAQAEATVARARAEKDQLIQKGIGEKRFAEEVEKSQFSMDYQLLKIKNQAYQNTTKVVVSEKLPPFMQE